MKARKALPHFLSAIAFITLMASFTFVEPREEAAAFKEEFRATWANMKAYTLQVAEAMPASKFTYKPTDEIRDFGGQLKHISFSIYYMPGVFIEGKDLPFDPNYTDNAALVGGSKDAIILLLKQRFDAIDQLVAGMSKKDLQSTVVLPFFDNKEVTKEELLVWLKNHTGHHNSQSIIYLRMNGITPPAYNGW
ncbi:MAG: DinB family protein [Roseivirga sp.]|nr:DinB family protein [Roseivirga sp.]